ncbi:DUF6378 domain-containing protein [Gordonia sp. MMO-8]|uniref:DUF6378 domain-containing protein n=1 Tax=Gordonia sp. MMO-8 TaxID=3127886 RepID=UPI00301A6176
MSEIIAHCHDQFDWFEDAWDYCPGCKISRRDWDSQHVDPLTLVTDAPPERVGVQIVGEAADVIDGDRQQNYGDAATNLGRIAAMWSTILGEQVEPHQSALCMVALKLARLIETPDHRDSYVDACGYLALAAELTLTDES